MNFPNFFQLRDRARHKQEDQRSQFEIVLDSENKGIQYALTIDVPPELSNSNLLKLPIGKDRLAPTGWTFECKLTSSLESAIGYGVTPYGAYQNFLSNSQADSSDVVVANKGPIILNLTLIKQKR
jgi:hypothetical protein